MKAKICTTTIKKLKPAAKAYEVRDTEISGFLLRVEPTGSMSYYYDYRFPSIGKRRAGIGRATRFSPVQARDAANKYRARVALGEDVQATKQQQREEAKLRKTQTLRGFIEHKYSSWALATNKNAALDIRRIEKNFPFLLDRPMTDINQWVVQKWQAESLKAGRKPTGINRDLGTLRGCLSRAVEWEVLEVHPLARVKQLKVDRNPPPRYLKPEQAKALIGAIDDREATLRHQRDSANQWRQQRGYALLPDLNKQAFADHLKPMVLLSLYTGLRRGEIFALTWADIDFSGRPTLTVRGTHAKSSQTRHVPLNVDSVDVLTQWRQQVPHAPDDPVFPGMDGKAFTNIKRSWTSVRKAAGLENFRWHDMRHTFASNLVQLGTPLNDVRDLLGHADLTMTLRYAHLAPDQRANAVAKLSKLYHQPAKPPAADTIRQQALDFQELA